MPHCTGKKLATEAAIAFSGKIVTCCYCGVQSAFVPGGKGVAALVCSTCGAPLAAQKARPLKADQQAKRAAAPAAPAAPGKRKVKKPPKPKRTYRKKRKSLFRKALSEVIDVIEDIFD